MDDNERTTLEREVKEHGARIAQLKSSLRDLEETVQAGAAPTNVASKVAQLRMELRGRTAAFAVGAARLQWED
jgi:hypothetical protein